MAPIKFNASQARTIFQYRNIKTKIMKCCANIYFNRQCFIRKAVLKTDNCHFYAKKIVVFIDWLIYYYTDIRLSP